jgi:flavin reductase (DIM6/NTAB) family NADH-FMN oxidoreductase RutF
LSVNPDEFRSVLGRFPSGVTIVTTRAANGSDQGMTVSAFCSVVNILSAEQEQLARRFSIVDIDRFEGVGYSRSQGGFAVLDDVLGVIECNSVATHDAGDHTIIVGEVEAARAETGTPLLYYRGGYAQVER